MDKRDDTPNNSQSEENERETDFPILSTRIKNHPEIVRADREGIWIYYQWKSQSSHPNTARRRAMILTRLAIFSDRPLTELDQMHAKELVRRYAEERELSSMTEAEYLRTVKDCQQSETDLTDFFNRPDIGQIVAATNNSRDACLIYLFINSGMRAKKRSTWNPWSTKEDDQ